MPEIEIDELDKPVYGAEAIAIVLNLLDEAGKPDTRRAYYVCERGYADVDKFGRIWTSTRRRLLKRHLMARETANE
jgi:hypothetical protein